ncbi:MAG: hypothetical protein M3Y59_06895 [Myxococcota bacterium]|nr:hypothetical protein [Myxococcota bacterium]
MSRLFPLLLLLALPALAAEKQGKTRSSTNGLYAIRLVEEAPGKCRVETLKDQAVHWSLNQCLATLDDQLYVSSGGDRFWVIRTLPQIPRRKRGSRKPPHLAAVVATLYEKDGRVVRQKRLGDFLQSHRLALVRKLDRHFKWLEGVYDVPGKGPRLTDQEQIELEAVGSKTVRLDFK